MRVVAVKKAGRMLATRLVWAALWLPTTVALGQSPEFVPDRFLVTLNQADRPSESYRRGTRLGVASVDRLNEDAGVLQVWQFSRFSERSQRTLVIRTKSRAHTEKLLVEYQRDPHVELAERIAIMHTVLTPNDPSWSSQWNYGR